MPITPQEALLRCIEHREIFHDEMLHLFRQIMSGEMSPTMIAALTIGLRVKKETIGEIAAAWMARRQSVQRGLHWLDRAAGAMFIAFGARLALTDNPSR